MFPSRKLLLASVTAILAIGLSALVAESQQTKDMPEGVVVENPVEASSAWYRADKADGMARTYLHYSSFDEGAKTSAVNIYKVPARDKDIQAFMQALKSSAQKDETLSPASCYLVNRGDLTTRQTWCEPENEFVVVVTESGPEKLGTRERTSIVQEQIYGVDL